ncbi:MAG: DUF1934 domain-containing protein [Clostridia bacterium]|nr:DUF1934 domain-containing protein [Clostridia bacterium]
MTDVIIKIKSTQGLGKEKESIELQTFGSVEISDESVALSYDESELFGSKVETVLTVSEDTAVMERRGEYKSRLVIKKGERNNCFYSTPHGELMIGIFGEEIKSKFGERGGEIFLGYTLDSNLQPISENTVEITVRKAEK